MRKMQLAIAALAGTLLFVALPDWSATGARTELTSIGPGGQLVHGEASTWHDPPRSGRLALFSADDNDLPGADGTRDIYLRDRTRTPYPPGERLHHRRAGQRKLR